MRPLKLTITLPGADAEQLDAALAAEQERANIPKSTSRELYAAMLVGRELYTMQNAPAATVPIGRGLLALAQLAHSEGIMRGWLPEGYSLGDFLADGIYDRMMLLMFRIMGLGDLRLLEEGVVGADCANDVERDRVLLIGPK